MRIEINNTYKFLFPIVNTFGKTFLSELKSLTGYVVGYPTAQSILKIGISDIMYLRAKRKTGCYLFIVFDVNGAYNIDKDFYVDVKKGKNMFNNFLLFVRKSKYYVDDYWYQKNQHCIVFDVSHYETAYTKFLLSEYSGMYKKEELKTLCINPTVRVKNVDKNNAIYAVLTKDQELGKKWLKQTIFENFGTDTVPDNPAEYDITWLAENEVLNYVYADTEERETIKTWRNGLFI